MSAPKGKKPTKDILDILHEAEKQNLADDMLSDAPVHHMTDDGGKADNSAEPVRKRTKVTKRINAETAELIDKYSAHKDEPALSDTQKLRQKLAEENGASDLLGYLAEENHSGSSERVDKLYEMIHDARTRTSKAPS